MSNWVVVLEEITEKLTSVQSALNSKIDTINSNVNNITSKVANLNTNPNEPLNILIVEQSWGTNPENTDWGFRQTGYVGAALWHYGKLAANLKDSFYKYADMNAVAASSTAMNAVAASSTAMNAVAASSTAMAAINKSSIAIGKYVAKLAGLNPTSYADMNAVAASSTAMNAVAASSTAMAAIRNSSKTTTIQPSPGVICSGSGILISITCASQHTGTRSFSISGKAYGPGVISVTTGNSTNFPAGVEKDNILSFKNGLSYTMTNSSYDTYPAFKVFKI